MPRRPSAPIIGVGGGSSQAASSSPNLPPKKPAESSVPAFNAASQSTVLSGSQLTNSQLTMEINANRYQKVVGALAGRLKNKVGL
ncbi:hypothetical protein D9756_000134 [Leucocoprinus leucothites]|uniref:Uncharacterized protein n=1 Tax=Leucocoprinus leucothites TaxID=201217 RepID=A0A8H5GEM2_9AGAR|nr:hypothetical protein D9756_000134 [Leucoagaricus leucothites]